MTFHSTVNPTLRTAFAEEIFNVKFRHEGCLTWRELAETLVKDVCGGLLPGSECQQLVDYIYECKFVPAGRYLYYAGRPRKFFNNCFLLRAEEDSREDWANLSWKTESALMTGGGVGCDYSVYRGEGEVLSGTGGTASGPIAKMQMINEIGRFVKQGGSRRSALYASLNWKHSDIEAFLYTKDWHGITVGTTGLTVSDLKQQDYTFPAPLDMTNISVNYDTEWLRKYWHTGKTSGVFLQNTRQAMRTGEPGFSFNFFDREHETLRNACTEVSSEDDSDICNLGAVNLSRVESLEELAGVVALGTKFLLCGTLRAEVPYERVLKVREKNRRLGLELMGVHEWLLMRGYSYIVNEELQSWLSVYANVSDQTAVVTADALGVSRPVAMRACGPTGTISLVASTTSGIEPLYAVAYKRRFLKNGAWHYQFVVDNVAQHLMASYDVDPDTIETALDLAKTPQRRIAFQAEIQRYVDMCISSTINLPAWGTEHNNEDLVEGFAAVLAEHASRLRGLTFYPDGARGGQPLTVVPYQTAIRSLGVTFEEHDTCKNGFCNS